MADIIIGISDDATTTEATAVVETIYNINVGEDIATSESLEMLGTLFVSQVDTVTTLENTGQVESDLISRFDTTTVSDFVGFYPDLSFVKDFLSQIRILDPFSPFLGDDIAVSEFVKVSAPPNPFAKVWNNIIRIATKNF